MTFEKLKRSKESDNEFPEGGDKIVDNLTMLFSIRKKGQKG